jgi:hypothetical protein
MAPPQPPAKRLRSSSASVGPRRRSSANAVVAGSRDSVSAPASAKRPPPGALPAASASARRNAEAGQLSLGFSQRDPYPIGMKVLLPETIYPNAAMVRRSIFGCFIN